MPLKRDLIFPFSNEDPETETTTISSTSFYNPNKRFKSGYLSPLKRAASKRNNAYDKLDTKNKQKVKKQKIKSQAKLQPRTLFPRSKIENKRIDKYSRKCYKNTQKRISDSYKISSIKKNDKEKKCLGTISSIKRENASNENNFFKNRSGDAKPQAYSKQENIKFRKSDSPIKDKTNENCDEGKIFKNNEMNKKEFLHQTNSIITKPKKPVQAILDAGQKRFGIQVCEKCDLRYTASCKEDEEIHAKMHKINPFKFLGWKTEKIIHCFSNGDRVIAITSDNKYHLKKLKLIESVINLEFGTKNEVGSHDSVTFLYISKKEIVGYCVVKEVDKAFRLSENRQTVEHSDTSEVARCGIYRIWVQKSFRRKKIATKLLDCIRENYILGNVIEKNKIAFSDPTSDGNQFACSYFGNNTYLIYKN